MWKRNNHKPKDPLLHILRIRITSSGAGDIFSYHVFYTGPKGNVTVPPARAELLKPEYMETSTHCYEYDAKTGELYVESKTESAVYIKVKKS